MSAHPTHNWKRIMPDLARRNARGETILSIAASLGVTELTLRNQRKQHLAAWTKAYEDEKPPCVLLDGPTLATLMERYIMARDLAPSTVEWYRRVVSVFENWYGGPVPDEVFTVYLVNQFLAARQDEGNASSYYRRSLRSVMRALLGFADKGGKVRQVKLEPLNPQSWSPEEIARLIEAAPDELWRTRIALGYYSGLSPCDLLRVEKRHIEGNILTYRRSKTGKLVKVKLPQWLVDRLPETGPACAFNKSRPWFCRVFAEIVKKAGLVGTPKKLRKSSGTLVESLHPGAGHLHLGNGRGVFERHYLHPERGLTPFSPPEIPELKG